MRQAEQLAFDLADIPTRQIPSTRYQGSKGKIVRWIWEKIGQRDFDTVLDAFGGTGVVGYWAKQHGKAVTYNDLLRFNYNIGLALIENSHARLSEGEIANLCEPQAGRTYRTFIADTFKDIYYTDDENHWLDVVVQNISAVSDRHRRALAYYALFQACLVKRPFNLFHRRNLYIRTQEVERSFGNKTTWDTPFEKHFRAFAQEVNALVCDNGRANRALNLPAEEVPGDYDLVYIDPPYLSASGVGVDYRAFYHFLEGLVRYDEWPDLVDFDLKHRPLHAKSNPWNSPSTIADAFRRVFDRFRNSILVVSYRSDGIPKVVEIERLLRHFKPKVTVHTLNGYQYVLSNRKTSEVLLIGE